MKFLGKKLYKKLRLIYLILFKKGFIYHFFQKHFTKLSLRENMANIEKSFNNFIRKKEHQYYKHYQKSKLILSDWANLFSNNLKHFY